MLGKAIFFGFLTVLVVGITNSLRMYWAINRILFSIIIRRSFLAGLGVGAAIYVSMQAFQIFYDFKGSSQKRSNFQLPENEDFVNRKISPEDLDPVKEKNSGEINKMSTGGMSPDKAAGGSADNQKSKNRENKSKPEKKTGTREEDAVNPGDASEIADLISETVDEE